MTFAALYDRYAGDAYRFALYLSGDPALAEDLAAETFARVWVVKDDVRIATVKAYLFTIIRNLYLQGLRRQSRMVPLEDVHEDRATSPEMLAEARSELRAVLVALQQLPPLDRAALLMRAQHQMPYEDIAAALDVSLAAIKVRIHRARLKLAGARHPSEEPS